MALESSIAISRSTRDMLKELGRKGETYDELILKLVREKAESSNPQDETT